MERKVENACSICFGYAFVAPLSTFLTSAFLVLVYRDVAILNQMSTLQFLLSFLPGFVAFMMLSPRVFNRYVEPRLIAREWNLNSWGRGLQLLVMTLGVTYLLPTMLLLVTLMIFSPAT